MGAHDDVPPPDAVNAFDDDADGCFPPIPPDIIILSLSLSLSLSLYSSKKTHRFNSLFHFCGYSYRHKAKEVDEEEVVVVKRTVFFFFVVQNASFLATWTKKMWCYETHRFDGKI